MNRYAVFFFLIFGTSALADEIKIKATIGDNTTFFTVKPVQADYVMSLQSNQIAHREVRIGKKNYTFVLQSSRKVIQLATEANKKNTQPVCQRDLSSVTVTTAQGTVSSASVCLLAKVPSSQELLSLLKVLQMAI